MLIPSPLVCAATSNRQTASAPIDVALRPGGGLLGQVVTSQGTPQGRVAIVLSQHGKKVATTTTERSGYFFLQGLQEGDYELAADTIRGRYRLWAPGKAPAAAQPGALLVAGQGPVRGQGPVGCWLSNPWILAGLVATAVAVPVAIHNARADRNSEPASP
jgi:hypothetical protein